MFSHMNISILKKTALGFCHLWSLLHFKLLLKNYISILSLTLDSLFLELSLNTSKQKIFLWRSPRIKKWWNLPRVMLPWALEKPFSFSTSCTQSKYSQFCSNCCGSWIFGVKKCIDFNFYNMIILTICYLLQIC